MRGSHPGPSAGAEVGWRPAGLPAFELRESGGCGLVAGFAWRGAHLCVGAPPQALEAGTRGSGQRRELFPKEGMFLSSFKGDTSLVTVVIFLSLP